MAKKVIRLVVLSGMTAFAFGGCASTGWLPLVAVGGALSLLTQQG